jgi:exodeoxyribonuclease VII small subunit
VPGGAGVVSKPRLALGFPLSAIKEIIMSKSSSKKVEKTIEELTYEEVLAELEEIVSALEGEQNRLEDAIKLFERGQALAARCGVLLEAAELKVKQVAGDEIIPFEELSE